MLDLITRARCLAFLDACSRGFRAYACLALVCLTLFIPGLSRFPVMDRDEARYAQATKQMLESGDFITIRFQDEFRNKKPVGIYWLQAAAVRAVGLQHQDQIWPYRLPSAIGATLSVLFCFGIGAMLTERRTAFLAALLLACSPLMQTLAHLATTDMVLLCAILAAQGCMLSIFTRLDQRLKPSFFSALGFWLAVGAGVLVKGPFILALCGSTGLLLWLRTKEKGKAIAAFQPWIGLPLLVAMVLPWYLAIQKVTNGAFVEESLGKDFLGKLIAGQESHGALPGFYLLLLPLTFWPAAGALVPGFCRAWSLRKTDWLSTVCLCWIIPYWIMIELAPTKLVHYMMPLYPAFAILAARELLSDSMYELSCKWLRAFHGYFRGLAWLVAPLLLLAGIAAPLVIEHRLLLSGVFISSVAAIYIWQRGGMGKERRLEGTGLVLCCSVLMFPWVFQGLGPGLKSLWMTPQIVDKYNALKSGGEGERLAIYGYHEPSLVFSTATDTLLAGPQGVAQAMINNPDCIGVVKRKKDAAFHEAMKSAGIQYRLTGTVAGFNYSKGKPTYLDFYCRD